MTFGENLKNIRNNQRLSQREMARRLNISQSYLGDLENNRKNVSLYVVSKLAKQLNISINKLINDDIEIRKCSYEKNM